MTRDEQLIKAALEMAAGMIEKSAKDAMEAADTSDMGSIVATWLNDEAEAIRAIDPAEVLAGLQPRCAECDEGILPCPFCGGPAEITEIDEGENAGGSCVCCTKCLASGNVEFGFKENFVSNWNRRVQLPAPNAVARLVQAGLALQPYLDWTIGPESPGYHPTMASAVAAFKAALAATETNHDH